jgi:hypothetical protein
MRNHGGLTADRLRKMPWHERVGMVASELSRTDSLHRMGGGSGLEGCVARARELMGVVESSPDIPPDAAAALAGVARMMGRTRLLSERDLAGRLCGQLTGIYASAKAPAGTA